MLSAFKQIYPNKVEKEEPMRVFLAKSKMTLLAYYGGAPIRQFSILHITCEPNNGYNGVHFYVVGSDRLHILVSQLGSFTV